MPIEISYNMGQSEGGSPWWASHKEFAHLVANLCISTAEVEDDADDDEWETPCVQNAVEGYVTIKGPYDYYDVMVTVGNQAIEIGTKTGNGRVTGGLNWIFKDDTMSTLSKGLISAKAIPAAPNIYPISHTYPVLRIPDNTTCRVAATSIAGGIQIAPNPGNFYVSVKVLLTFLFHIQITATYVLTLTPGQKSVLTPYGPEHFGDGVFDNTIPGALTPSSDGIAPVSHKSIVRIKSNLEDPLLKEQTGLNAQIAEDPEIAEKIKKTLERFQKSSGRHKKKEE